MKYINLFLLVIFNSYCIGQIPANVYHKEIQHRDPKLKLDSSTFGNWPYISLSGITDNGNYFAYVIQSEKNESREFILESTVDDWEIRSTLKEFYSFTYDSRYAVWINEHDSLCIARLGLSEIRYIPNVLFFSIQGKYMSYQLKDYSSSLLEVNIRNNKIVSRLSAKESVIMESGNIRLLLVHNSLSEQLVSVRRGCNERKVLWEGTSICSLIKDKKSNQIAFFSGSNRDSIFYYKIGADEVNSLLLNIDSNILVSRLTHFSSNGMNIFIHLVENARLDTNLQNVTMNLWTYKDTRLRSEQLIESNSRTYRGVVRMSDYSFNRLDSGNDWIFLPSIHDTVALIRRQKEITPGDETHWNSASVFCWYLKSINYGHEISLEEIRKNVLVEVSPSGKFVIYYDEISGAYFVYETCTGTRRNLTLGIDENWKKNFASGTYGRCILGWDFNDERVFIKGEYDIWEIDPSGRKEALNLTNGYGKRHRVIFDFALEEYSRRGFKRHEAIILTAFNIDNKENGFYMKRLGKEGDPDSLTMGSFIYSITGSPCLPAGANYAPLKALHSRRYIVRRMSASAAPNFFVTSDFIVFKRLTNLYPEKLFNWYRSELHSWRSLNGDTLQGVLYKPEDFDSHKKYPVIFYYYERRSDALNLYMEPRALESGCAINIPYYVSNGYLVFSPDIYYAIGNPMQGTYDALISAANYLGAKSYVDATKMGLQGCSWGGIQTNYIVTHCDLFAAACSASGITNWVSSYCGIKGLGESMQGMYEVGQFRMGGTLWQKTDTYIKNSAVFYVHKISTPLLLMHTINDKLCSFDDIFQFYSSLYRLRKKGWLLVYDGNHGVFGKDEVDFSIRMKQFFDHYLKNSPAPKWMTHPSSDWLHNTDDGLGWDARGF
ncbi:prolyl oligopeptidase family serine peptidase [Chitinophaga sp. CC14]|uniref:alpha/beta hydrolase family protein n=1 Tax=Chitinophaga sp. CC14 TaxID=3029199 RepID=UPI003B82BEBD